MTTDPLKLVGAGKDTPELPIEELLRRGRPMPARDQTAIPDLTDDDWEEFLGFIKR